MPACMATGQAAGVAAAVAIDGNATVRNVNIEAVQSALRELKMPLKAHEIA